MKEEVQEGRKARRLEVPSYVRDVIRGREARER